jgi:Uma2 family endonuclease
MSTAFAAPPVVEEQNVPRIALWPLSTSDFEMMRKHRIILPGDPVELIDGCLVRANAVEDAPQLDDLSIWCDVELENGVERLPIWRLSVRQYEAMIEVEILQSGDKCELIDGLLVRRMTLNSRHYVSSHRVRRLLEARLPQGYHLRAQGPILLDNSEPEPDVSIVQGEVESFMADHPGTSNVPLVIEVSDSSLRYDRTTKLHIYARNHIREYWIVNLIDRQIEVHRQPTGAVKEPTYREKLVLKASDSFELVIDRNSLGTLRVADLLPPA